MCWREVRESDARAMVNMERRRWWEVGRIGRAFSRSRFRVREVGLSFTSFGSWILFRDAEDDEEGMREGDNLAAEMVFAEMTGWFAL